MSMVAKGVQTGRGPAGPGGLRWRLARLEDENAGLREEQQRLEAERERLRGENERAGAGRGRAPGLKKRLAGGGGGRGGLQELNERRRGGGEALRRAAKRQAAPFSKGDPTPHPKRPGRKPGAAYGTRAHRRAPAHVDQVVQVGLPACCPGCGGALALERVAVQYQEELPPA